MSVSSRIIRKRIYRYPDGREVEENIGIDEIPVKAAISISQALVIGFINPEDLEGIGVEWDVCSIVKSPRPVLVQ